MFLSVSVDYAIREATEDDADFIVEMVVQAANWDPRNRRRRSEIETSPIFRSYFEGWQREGDFGLIASHDDVPIGAAWLRLHDKPEANLAGVSPDIPVVAVGVAQAWQNRGVGRALLRILIDEAAERGYSAVSLSVDPASFASRVARSMGFINAGSQLGNHTMLKELRAD